jgi:serine/threonine protein kinase
MLISLGSDATLMISDFGMSKKVGVAGRSDTPITKGTESYAPPEVFAAAGAAGFDTFLVNGGNTNAFAVDVWTLGVCLSNLVIGVEIFKAAHLTKPQQAVFTEMQAAQRRAAATAATAAPAAPAATANPAAAADENGVREACSAVRWSAALSRFNRLDPSLQSLLDRMLRVDPEARFTLAQVAEHPWVRGIPQPPLPPAEEPQLRSLAAAPPAVDAPQHRSLAATAPAYKSLAAADEAEEPRYNACSAAPTAAAYRSMSAAAEEAEMPPIGRCIARTLV